LAACGNGTSKGHLPGRMQHYTHAREDKGKMWQQASGTSIEIEIRKPLYQFLSQNARCVGLKIQDPLIPYLFAQMHLTVILSIHGARWPLVRLG